ncbi:MAG: Pantothenate synthetase [Bacteroidota bacterium]|nr:Pantothenate synthetase [Bacteroidota bacterium]
MEVIKTISEMQKISLGLKASGKRIACVPTMGYLHEGHASLIRRGKEIADEVITTIFVNPTQFAPNEDFEKYPRNFERDCEIAQSNGCSYVFHPDILDMYPIGFSTEINISKITKSFEGLSRPTHFTGVATVVAKLFNATLPDIAIFGQKDYQQSLVVKQLSKDLNFPIQIIIAPTFREADGLAMSSRNVYLSREERAKAAILFHSLEAARKVIMSGERSRKMVNGVIHSTLRSIPEIKIDYACSAIADTLEEPDEFLAGERIVLLLAVYLGRTRLIDNAIVPVPRMLDTASDRFIEGI